MKAADRNYIIKTYNFMSNLAINASFVKLNVQPAMKSLILMKLINAALYVIKMQQIDRKIKDSFPNYLKRKWRKANYKIATVFQVKVKK